MLTRRGLFSARCLPQAQSEGTGSRAATALVGPRARYFPNYPLQTHTGRSLRFYDDLVHRRIVVFNMMYADCNGVCPTVTANLVKVQRALGDRVGRDIFMYSITLQPAVDTPAVLNEYVQHHDVGPGWLFLTGRPAELDTIRRRLGFFDPDPKIDSDRTSHSGLLRLGNEQIDSWSTCSARAKPAQILEAIRWMDVGARART